MNKIVLLLLLYIIHSKSFVWYLSLKLYSHYTNDKECLFIFGLYTKQNIKQKTLTQTKKESFHPLFPYQHVC